MRASPSAVGLHHGAAATTTPPAGIVATRHRTAIFNPPAQWRHRSVRSWHGRRCGPRAMVCTGGARRPRVCSRVLGAALASPQIAAAWRSYCHAYHFVSLNGLRRSTGALRASSVMALTTPRCRAPGDCLVSLHTPPTPLQTELEEEEFMVEACRLHGLQEYPEFLELISEGARPDVAFLLEGCVREQAGAASASGGWRHCAMHECGEVAQCSAVYTSHIACDWAPFFEGVGTLGISMDIGTAAVSGWVGG